MATDRRVTFLIGANIQNFQKGLSSAQKRFRKFGRDMQRIGSTMSRNITLPVAAAGVAVVKAAGDFEDSFADIRKTVDASNAEFAVMEKELRSLAKTVPTSVNELNRMAGVAGQLGIGTGNIVEFTKTIAMLGDATDVAGEQAALSLSRFMNVMGTAESDIDRLGSAIVGLGNNFAAMESEIINIATSMAPLGNSIGLTEQQVLAFATTIAASGGQAEAASTAFQKTANIMKQAVISGNSDLQTFAETAGMSSSAFQQAFQQDAAGALQSFLQGLRRVQEQGGSTVTILEQLGLADQRLTREFGKVLGNLGDLDEALQLSNQEWQRNTALTEEAQKRYSTFNSRLSILYNNLYDLGIVIGNTLIPVVNKLIDISQSVINWFSNLDESTIRIGVTIGVLAAAIGPLVWGFGTLITSTAAIMGALSGLMGIMMTLGKGVISVILTGSFTKFAALLRLVRMKGIIPLGKSILVSVKAFALIALKVAAVIAIVGGIILIAKSIIDAWDKVGPFFANLWDKIVIAFAGATKWIIESISGILSIIPGMTGMFEGLKLEMDNMAKAAQERIDARGVITFGETVGAVWDEMKNNASASVDFVKDKFNDMNSFVSGLLPSFDFGGGQSPEGGARENPVSTATMPVVGIAGVEQFHKDLSSMKAATGEFATATGAALSGTSSGWDNFVKQSKAAGFDFVNFLTSNVSNAIASFSESIGVAFSGADNEFATGFEKIILLVVDFAKQLGQLLIGIGTAIAFIPGMQGPAGLYIGGGAALVALASGVSAGIKKRISNRENRASQDIPGMASGGIVPAGFPNDTYPAMLSSGETVIPAPKPLPNMGGGRQVIENHLYIDGREVEISLENRGYRKSR